MAEWVSVLAAAVQRWPTQWFTFYDYWPAAASTPARQRRRPEAAD
jgi:predicted LPLAT superfamily acyltransferase